MAVEVVVDVVVVVEPVLIVGRTAADSFSFSFSLSALSSDQYLMAQMHGGKEGTGAADLQHPAGFTYLLVRLVEPVRVEEPRPRRPGVEVTDEEVVVVVEESDEVVVEELRSSCLLPKEPLENPEEPPDVNGTLISEIIQTSLGANFVRKFHLPSYIRGLKHLHLKKRSVEKRFTPSFEPWLHPRRLHIDQSGGDTQGMVKR